MKVTIHADSQIVFEPPLLTEIGDDRRALGGETPTFLVRLDNARGDASRLLLDPPLRSRVTLDTGTEMIEGALQGVVLDTETLLRIEV